MTRKWQWSDPKVWIPLLTVIIGSIVGPIIVFSYQGFFNNSLGDKIPPTVHVPQSPLKTEATTTSGSIVTYAVSATDGDDGTITPQCTPSSGSTFPIGNTEVICTATDKAGNRAEEERFTITVVGLVPLKLYYSDSRQDNFLVATDQEDVSDKYPGYFFVRTEGYIYSNQQEDENLVPLKLYYSDSRQDNFLVATDLTVRSAVELGYFFVRTEGYIYSNQQEDENLVPLKLYYSDSRQEFFTVATEEGVSDAERAGYRLIGTEGFVYPANYFPDQ